MDGCVMCLSTGKMQDNKDKKKVLIKYRVQENTQKKKSGRSEIFRTRPDWTWGPPSLL